MQRRLRLTNPRDFARLRSEGRTYHHQLLMMSVAPNGLTHSRYGFITGKRIGKAVVRNRVRRQLRAAMQAVHPRLRPGFDVVLIARPALVGQSLAGLQQGLDSLVRKAGLEFESGVPHEKAGPGLDSIL